MSSLRARRPQTDLFDRLGQGGPRKVPE